MESNIYTELTEAIISDNSDIAVCALYHLHTDGKRTEGKIPPRKTINSEEFVELVFSFGEWNNTHGAGGFAFKLFRTETISGIRFINSKEIVEDELFCIEAATKSTRISVLPTLLYGYRQRSGSLVRNDRFMFRHLKCRELCIPLAARISEHAHLVAISAYLPIILNYSKCEAQFNGVNNDVISPDTLNKFLLSDICPKKVRSLYRMFAERPLISRIYLKIRATFHVLFKKEKRRQTNLFD